MPTFDDDDAWIQEQLDKAIARAPRGKRVRPPAAIDMKINLLAERDLAQTVREFLRKQPLAVAGQAAPALAKAEGAAFDDPRIDALLEQLRASEDDEERRAIKMDLSRLVGAALDFDGWDVLIDPTERELAAVHESGQHQANKILEIPEDDSIVHQVHASAVAWAKERAAELVGKRWDKKSESYIENPNARWRIDESTRNMIGGDVVRAIEEGWSTDKLATVLAGNYAFSDQRAEMIARTEVINANNSGNMDSYRASGVVTGKVWLAGNDSPNGPGDEPCDECEENADEGIIDLGDVFPSGDESPPAHPHCRCAVAPVTDEGEAGDATDGEEE